MNKRIKKKKQKTVLEPTTLELELERVQKKLQETDVSDPEYDRLLKRAGEIERLIESVDKRENPPKDKISKADWLKTGVTILMFGVTFIPELKGHITFRSPLRRFVEKPRLWGNDLKT